MSKDIRSFFSKANNGPDKNLCEKEILQAKKRNRQVIESDDENNESETSKKKHIESKKILKSKGQSRKSEIVVKVENFFENIPVSQKKQTTYKKDESTKSETTVKHAKAKKKESKFKSVETDFKFEVDDELDASLVLTKDEELVKNVVSTKQNDKSSLECEKKSQLKTEKNTSVDNIIKSHLKLHTINEEEKKDRIDKSSVTCNEYKKKNAEAYHKYLNRSGPKNPGAKEIPKGSPTCLQGLAFVITGVLDSLEREEAVELIKKCGGHVANQISKKTNFVVVGEEPGVSKIEKAKKLGTKKINEDDLLNLIKNKVESAEKVINETIFKKTFENLKPNVDDLDNKDLTKFKEGMGEIKISILPDAMKAKDDLLLVDKYKPKSTKNIVGQNGEKSNVKKLTKWLQNWHKNHSNKEKKKPYKPVPWHQTDDGCYYKAALLSGPPGVGKTTTVHLVCQELGFDIIEFNASDTRSKKLLQEEVLELLSSKSIRGYLKDTGDTYKKHVLVMDEVDGMAGNEDRGGIQELIQLIKNTKVPIVGICNDRNHVKMRSLVNHCFDLRFQRPRIEQIKGALKSICFKENIDISGEALEELIVASNHDLRQILHNLTLLASNSKTISSDDAKKKSEVKKPLNLSPWDVVRKVFSAVEQQKINFVDKTDLFFQDYSLGPLFVQETYLRVKPHKAKNNEKKELELISETADSLALGDVFEKTIRSQNAWSLLPVQAIFSSVLPGHKMSGHIQGQVQFPIWFGKNSKKNKVDRLLQDLHSSLKISITGSKDSINLDYLHHLKDSIIRPMANKGLQGVQESLKFMLHYQLTRDDLDHIVELSTWAEGKDISLEVDSKVKAALTRAINKERPSVFHKARKTTKLKRDDEMFFEETEEEIENEDDDDDNFDLDPMIKKGKKRPFKEESTSKGNKRKMGKVN